MESHFPSTRDEALKRLRDFLENEVTSYARERNFVRPGHGNVSRLSAAIRHRLITEEEVIDGALRLHRPAVIEKFLQEVVWRSYWKGWLELRPGVWNHYTSQIATAREHFPEPVLEECERVAGGHSTSSIMNHFARELIETGYLHNHARMWWAGYWIHHCRLPWQLGAAHFFRHLLDADPASNTLSWRWVAGLQTRGKSYVPHQSNLEKYCDPSILAAAGGADIGESSAFESESDVDLEKPGPPPNDSIHPIPSGRTALLIHDEDLSPETGPLRALRPLVVFQYIPEVSDETGPRITWLNSAREDARMRVENHFSVSVEVCRNVSDIRCFAARNRCETVALMAPALGPLADRLSVLLNGSDAMPPWFIPFRRTWDSRIAGLCQKGFFPFWQAIRKTLVSAH